MMKIMTRIMILGFNHCLPHLHLTITTATTAIDCLAARSLCSTTATGLCDPSACSHQPQATKTTHSSQMSYGTG